MRSKPAALRSVQGLNKAETAETLGGELVKI
jgi:hypothetical protein